MVIPVLVFDEGFYCKPLQRYIQPGRHQAASEEEYEAIKGYAKNAPEVVKDESEIAKDELVKRAVELKLAAPSTLARWSVEKLTEAIASAEEE